MHDGGSQSFDVIRLLREKRCGEILSRHDILNELVRKNGRSLDVPVTG
jgi:hypothetical protein